MNVLVIGGSGLLGSYTVNETLKRGYTVFVLSRGNNEKTWIKKIWDLQIKVISRVEQTISQVEFLR